VVVKVVRLTTFFDSYVEPLLLGDKKSYSLWLVCEEWCIERV